MSAIDFGQFRLRPAFFFEFGQFDFGQFDVGQFLDVEFWDDKVWGPRRVGAQRVEAINLEKVGPRRVEPRRVEPRRVGGPKFRAFFPSSATIFFLLSLSWGPFVEFWWCLKRWGPEMCTFGLSDCRVKPRRPHQTGPPGFHTTARELQTCIFEGPGASNTTKIQREDTQRGKKRTKFVAGEGKKARNFGPPTLRASNPSGPHWVWPLACIKKTKQLKITKKKTFLKNPNN